MLRMKSVQQHKELPFKVHRELLGAVFGKMSTLLIGHCSHSLGAVICWGITDDQVFLIAPVYLLIVVAYRWYVYRMWGRLKDTLTTTKELRTWERHYIVGSLGVAGGVGILCGYGVFFYYHTLVNGISVGLAVGTMISVVGRNFGSLTNVKFMSYACCGPIIISLIVGSYINQDVWLGVTAFLLAPVIVTSIQMATYLNELIHRLLEAMRASEIASTRFDLAISNMHNGLVMIDAAGKVVVINEPAAKALELSKDYVGDFVSGIRGKIGKVDVEIVADALEFQTMQEEIVVESWNHEGPTWLQFSFKRIDGTKEIRDKTDYSDELPEHSGTVVIIEDITARRVTTAKLNKAANFDGLTGLANRAHWEARAATEPKQLDDRALVALAVMDVDRFKLINDTLGHGVGDIVLKGIAEGIMSVDDPRIIAGRLGGDEYVICIPGVANEREAYRIFDKVFQRVNRTYVVDSTKIEVRCSGGVVLKRCSEFSLDKDLSRADMALYKVKRNPNQAWMMFDSVMADEYETSQRIKIDLKNAIRDGTLEVVYQPIFNANGTKVLSAEALCRWNHAAVGYISPSEFIAMAEEIGVIGKLTEYVLRSACRDCVSWGGNIGVSVNLSVIDLSRPDIVDRIKSALAEFDLPASKLCIEVTETVFVSDYKKTAETLQTLRDLGVRTAIDDFGTGYSSLSYLHTLPLNRVKIDRSFVSNIDRDVKTQKLFKAVVGLAQQLDFEIVVEGVETNEQLAYILDMPNTVDMIQGHIFKGAVTSDGVRNARSNHQSAPSNNVVTLPSFAGTTGAHKKG